MQPPDFSVVIPAHRRPAELAEAIGSVLGQEGVSVEVIVVDDCPAGSARTVVEAVGDPRVAYRRNPEPSGGRPAAVRNFGLGFATGDFVQFLDDDDRVPAGHFRAVKAAFAADPATRVVFGRVAPFGADPAAVEPERAYFAAAGRRALRCRPFGRWAFAAAMVFRPTLLVCGAGVVRRSCLAPLGGFDPRLPLMEDVDFYARAIRAFGVRFLDRLALHYRIGPSLMHGAARAPVIARSYAAMHGAYRARHGLLEYALLKLLAKAIRP